MLGLVNRLAAAAAAVAVLVAASGCMRLDMELVIRSDDSVGGSFTVAWSEEFLADVRSGETEFDESDLDAFVDALLEGVPEGERSEYREGGFVGQTASFAGRPLSEFAEAGQDEWGFLRIAHEGRRYILEGSWDLRTTGFIEPEQFADAEFIVSVGFPARVTYHNGDLEGRTVTWRMVPGQDYELRAEAEQYNGWVFLLIGAAAILVVVGLLWLWQWKALKRHSHEGPMRWADLRRR